ncbi:receptor-type guanylate cyclase gcy-3-like [Trichogramma pretiosum]|uniref:receptor-type guanylate cyclase gcy-3-like n=1 Tax=Trichogramma pretiosum TaxID=7493 RepID=UPI0006C97097|nr:receptor-type guanylate cyclase gcy-3-like [Trichogramma pretiosum]XP_014237001.1 receptor-type guanylate cyclase gcy-3-like [Trichogramma pretiosum]XP_023317070.1 receptor-type guanylate cyclase gcy-3-like [Trichogramma pretiosum]
MRVRHVIIGLLVLVCAVNTAHSNKCLTMLEEVNPKRIVRFENEPFNIKFEASTRVTHRLVTKIMKIYLQEVLGYSDITIVDVEDDFNITANFARLSENLTNSRKSIIPESMVNMEVWIPPHLDTTPLLDKHDVLELGSVGPPGHFGWFIPVGLSRLNDSWITFTKQETAARFDVSEVDWRKIANATIKSETEFYCKESFCQDGMYVPTQCQANKLQSQPCAMLLADYSSPTKFIKDHIDHYKLYVKVAWVGPNLKHLIKYLTKEYLQSSNNEKSLVVLHYTPSSVIPNESEYVNVDFPRCGSRGSHEGCLYETRKLEKLVWNRLEPIAKLAFEAINRVKYTEEMYEALIDKYNEKLVGGTSYSKLSAIENEVACDWLRDNLRFALTHWMPNDEDKNTLIVGGIFPMTGSFYTAKSIVLAAQMAKQSINHNKTILRDYNLKMLINDGQCKSDLVMKSFIDYILHNYYSKLIGVLGPACSETIEPLAGVSKHFYTVIMSYGAEGSSFSDRSRYPYFFRTIGENRQYQYVYLQLLQKFGWHRVAAFSEDGLKYTEYISYMQDMLRDNGIEFVVNIKFPREWEPEVLTKYLEELKQKRARIIIADVYDQVARLVMCEAYRHEMTAKQNYVWFLPIWLRSNWFDTDYYNSAQGESTPCSTAEMKMAINGHLGISHATYAPDDSIMQEGITVRDWRDRYERYCSSQKEVTSPYAGYAYDAMWTYAYAVDALLKENSSYIFDLHSEHTVSRFTDIISKTDFNGVSGRIKFVGGPSRFPVINIYQHIDGEMSIVGDFHPNISEETSLVSGGTLNLNMSSIVWLSGKMPDDGKELPASCLFPLIAQVFGVSCFYALIIFNVFIFVLLIIGIIITVLFIKKSYERRVKRTEYFIQSLGLDLHNMNNICLDRWEMSRNDIVMNRKIGEGAFGTVYGGEARFPEKGGAWVSVAVKTLKQGSTAEDKYNFFAEANVMKRFDHQNIVKLLGVHMATEPALAVMEFMLYGDLKTYLLARRGFVNERVPTYDYDEISDLRLTSMALDVSRALAYLAENNYVHRDIASRNCLLNAQRQVKLGDFGMTRYLYNDECYHFNRKGMLPVRWMSPEAIRTGNFTLASDVWAYGVLVFEIITFGNFPYQGMSNNQVITYVEGGNTISIPKEVDPKLKDLLLKCWSFVPAERPAAKEIVDFLGNNSRIISPCLDAPVASVQLEHTGEMEMHMNNPPNDRKPSFPRWPAAQQNNANKTTSTTITPATAKIMETIELNGINANGGIVAETPSVIELPPDLQLESSQPLLSNDDPLNDYCENESAENQSNRYVNMKPGVTVDIRLEDSVTYIPNGRPFS